MPLSLANKIEEEWDQTDSNDRLLSTELVDEILLGARILDPAKAGAWLNSDEKFSSAVTVNSDTAQVTITLKDIDSVEPGLHFGHSFSYHLHPDRFYVQVDGETLPAGDYTYYPCSMSLTLAEAADEGAEVKIIGHLVNMNKAIIDAGIALEGKYSALPSKRGEFDVVAKKIRAHLNRYKAGVITGVLT